MLHPDVVSLREFYSSPLGLCVRRDVARAIARFWDIEKEASLVGIGFSQPYLRRFLSRTKHVSSIMFAQCGAMYWPADTSNHTTLADERHLPLADNSVQRIIACHAIEHSAHLTSLMNEIYRSLLPGGKALMIVPNRMGQWSSSAKTPFGYGHPYQISQMKHRAELAGLTYVASSSALFYPPSNWRITLKFSRAMELLGRFLLPNFGGILLVEVEKQIYASIPEKGTPVAATLLYPTIQKARTAPHSNRPASS